LNCAGFKGFVTPEMIKQALPAAADDVAILICGPDPMVKMMQKHCQALDYKKDQVLTF
jgi:cytochrome-b5 reductase